MHAASRNSAHSARFGRARLWAIASIAVIAVLVGLLYLETRPAATPEGQPEAQRPLRVYCAAALRPVMRDIAAEYLKETGRGVEFDFGDSGAMLGNATVRPDGDLFLPADDSFVRLAEERGLVAQTIPLCRMRAVVITRPGNPHAIAAFEDLLDDELKVGIANPDRAAIGKVVRDELQRLGKWDALAGRIAVQHTTVTDAANAVQLGSTDAAVVWDAVAGNYPELAVVKLPELAGAVGRVELAVLKSAPDPAKAQHFARFISASDKGLSLFRKSGFSEVESGTVWTAGEP